MDSNDNKNTLDLNDKELRRLFLANISHEVRTPMNAIMGISELLLKKAEDPEDREYLLNIKRSSRSLMTTINNLLDYESIILGDFALENEAFRVQDLIEEVISVVKVNVGDGRISFLVDTDPTTPSVLNGDSLRIGQVLVQLLSNAEKFTESGHIKLTQTWEKRGDKARIHISVEDTGKGFSMEMTDRVFEARGPENLQANRERGGLGIGLAISKAVVELLGGKLNADSIPGKGTRFSFEAELQIVDEKPVMEAGEHSLENLAVYLEDKDEEQTVDSLLRHMGIPHEILPGIGEILALQEKKKFTGLILDKEKYDQVKDSEELCGLGIKFLVVCGDQKGFFPGENAAMLERPVRFSTMSRALKEQKEGQQELRETFTTSGVHVLIVDDNDINLKICEELLKPYGITSDKVTSGEEALKQVSRTHYDMVFMDHMMPGMDGVETTVLIRQKDDPYYKDLPVIALTANAINGAEKMFMAAGMNDFLAKPIVISELEAVLIKWIPAEKITFVKETVSHSARTVSGFENFSHIDVNTGLSYTGGNVPMYSSIIADFAKAIRTKKKLLNTLVMDEDIGRFTIEVHSLKSVSKTIGALSLSDMALELERDGHKRDQEAINKNIGGLNREIDYVIGDLLPFMTEEEDTGKKLPLDKERAQKIIKDLYYAAADFDYEGAKERMEELDRYEYSEKLRKILNDIRDSIEDIDYDGAKMSTLELLAYIIR